MCTFESPTNKYYPLKTQLFAVVILFFSSIPFAFSQNHFYQTERGLPCNNIQSPAGTSHPGSIDTTNYILDYYLSDSYAYSGSYMSLQGQLINSYYTFPDDTNGSYRHTTMFSQNYYCINSISVAFDSLYSGSATLYPWSLINIAVDTIYVPIIQINHSLQNDTLVIELTSVNSDGYPNTGTYLLDTMVINTDTTKIGNGNDNTIKVIKWPLNNYELFGNSKFAVTVNYYDHTKVDSCWFVYGYGYFNSTCPYDGSNTTFANPTHFCNISNSVKPFNANSFTLWNEYSAYGYLPTGNGDNVFFPCTAADTNSYQAGIDGANYLQNIDIYASIRIIQNTGINSINPALLKVGQNYPNPFTTLSSITYSLARESDLTLRVVDLAGRELLHENYTDMEPGQHSISLSGTSFQPGIYFYSISSSGYTVTKKMVIY